MCNVDDCTWRSLNSFVFPLFSFFMLALTSQVAQTVKHLPTMQETWVQSLGRKFPREGNGNPLQYSCLENPMDRGAQ